MLDKSTAEIETSKRILVHYFKLALADRYQPGGDVEAEIEYAVDCLVTAAREIAQVEVGQHVLVEHDA